MPQATNTGISTVQCQWWLHPWGTETCSSISIQCVLCDTWSIMFSIHSEIYYEFTTGFLSLSYPQVLLIVWGHNTAILSAKSSWSNKICLCWSEKTCQDIWTLGECATNEREVVSCNTHFLFRYFWLSLPLFFPRICGQQKLSSWHKTRSLFLKFSRKFNTTMFKKILINFIILCILFGFWCQLMV